MFCDILKIDKNSGEVSTVAAGFERREHDRNTSIWAGKYRNLHNLPHWHLEHELIACRNGSAVLSLDGNLLSLPPNSAAFCPSGSIHHIDADREAIVIVAQLDPKLLAFLGSNAALRSPVFADRYGVFESIDVILAELKEHKPYYARRAEAVMLRVCIDIVRAEEAQPHTADRHNALSRYRELLSSLDSDIEFITFSEAAKRMHMSEGYFSRYFKHLTGMSFSDYVNLVKVDHAVGILKSAPKTATTELALRSGFNTLRSFNRNFRRITGYSPKQLPPDFSLHIRQYAIRQEAFDPTLAESVPL